MGFRNFTHPFTPDIDITKFQGEVFHSRDYNVPERFAKKRLLLVGRGPSGVDIALELAQFSTEVFLFLTRCSTQT